MSWSAFGDQDLLALKHYNCTPEINITQYVNSTGMKIKNLLPEGKHVTLMAHCHNHLGTPGVKTTPLGSTRAQLPQIRKQVTMT